jgi:hypothetical protein
MIRAGGGMADGKRMVCVAIGVADAVRGQFLSGALNDAKRFHEWADTLGYESTLVTDEEADRPVTLQSLRAVLEAALWPQQAEAAGTPRPPPVTDRLIVYFAGHGLLRNAEEGLWLLSDWAKEMKGVGINALKHALYRYPVNHLAIISDACLSLPSDMDQAEVKAEGVLGKGPTARTEPWYDRFVATQDGTTTFMVPGPDPEDDRCIFSGVLLEGLWGLNDAAFSKRAPNVVTGNSLSVFLKNEVQRVSALYSDPRVPSVGATFPDGEDIYFEKNPRIKPPEFPPWPPRALLLEMGLRRTFGPLKKDPGPVFADGRRPRIFRDSDDRGIPRRKAPETKKRARPKAFFPGMLEQFRSPAPSGHPHQTGLAAFGAPVTAIWRSPRVNLHRIGIDWWTVGLATRSNLPSVPARLLVEFADGPVVATVAFQDMITKIARDAHGASGIIMPEFFEESTAEVAQQALGAMEHGELHGEKAVDLAVQLRQLKHVDPVLGVISAYLYDAIGDVESIRRMAYFYVRHEQAIPYDIALLGLLHGSHLGGELWVAIPPVPKRKPRTPLEEANDWTFLETQASAGMVGGDWPWLRQGWTYLEDPGEEESTLIAPELLEVAPHLTPGRFATVDRAGAEILARRFGLQRHPQ